MMPDGWLCVCMALSQCMYPGSLLFHQRSHAEMSLCADVQGVAALADEQVTPVEEDGQAARHQDAQAH